LHALVTSKRGDLLALGLARLRRLAPDLRTIGLSATVAEPEDLRAYLVEQPDPEARALSHVVEVAGGAGRTSPSSTARNGCPGPAIPRAMPSATSID
jgi:Lhr-like helicase